MKVDNFDVFSKRIDEAKGDNLHQFVQYMREYGKQEELKPCSVTAYDKFSKNTFYIDDVVDSFDTFGLQSLVYDYCIENNIEMCDEFGDEIEFSDEMDEPMSFIEDMDDFNKYCINLAEDHIFADLMDDNRNMIYIEREITVPKFINKDKFYDLLKRDYDGKLGIWWTYCEGNAEAQWGEHHGDSVTLYGYVSPEDVDWDETIRANLFIPDEKELTLKEGATIELDCVKTERGHTIFKGNLLYKA